MSKLTPCEKQHLLLAIKGHTLKMIAYMTMRSVKTAEKHAQQVKIKLGTHTVYGDLREAILTGEITISEFLYEPQNWDKPDLFRSTRQAPRTEYSGPRNAKYYHTTPDLRASSNPRIMGQQTKEGAVPQRTDSTRQGGCVRSVGL
jgi:DNA-binding CsgD family transcriptional regulator